MIMPFTLLVLRGEYFSSQITATARVHNLSKITIETHDWQYSVRNQNIGMIVIDFLGCLVPRIPNVSESTRSRDR